LIEWIRLSRLRRRRRRVELVERVWLCHQVLRVPLPLQSPQ
jgi:hypothetical protein